jgi:hypothetical protein
VRPAALACAALLLLLPGAARAERTELTRSLCASDEILQDETCIPCPEDRQAVVNGHDICREPGQPMEEEEDDDSASPGDSRSSSEPAR